MQQPPLRHPPDGHQAGRLAGPRRRCEINLRRNILPPGVPQRRIRLPMPPVSHQRAVKPLRRVVQIGGRAPVVNGKDKPGVQRPGN